MDLKQNKLTKTEWESIEKIVGDHEKKILSMIIEGYDNVNIRYNETKTLNSYIRFDGSTEMDYFLFKKYFENDMMKVISKYGEDTPLASYSCSLNRGKLKKIKSGESIRLNNLDNKIKLNTQIIFEFVLVELFVELVQKSIKRRNNYAFYLYTIIQLKKATISNINVYVLDLLNYTIDYVLSFTNTSEIITNAYQFIEQNKYLLKYEDKQLFKHQRDLFSICKQGNENDGIITPKLILYTAPTGTGKTMSPIGLASHHRIIFVCVARHIGLALAKSAISMEKKVAFAFGCESASDIRLHYFSAVDYKKNNRSGGIGKVNNSVGDNVQIMICDVQSYITAMHYMLAFNSANTIITYWDEPTITLDCENHDLHAVIHQNWSDNVIPTVVLSCATLPNDDDMQPVYADFRAKFDDADIHVITSYDCRKSIPILDTQCKCVLPHYLYSSYHDIMSTARYCKANLTLLRYFDLREIITFIEYVNRQHYIDEMYSIDSYFSNDITTITMNSLKEYYLEVLLHMNEDSWSTIYTHMHRQRKSRFDEPRTNIQKTNSYGAPTNTPSNAGKTLSRTTSLHTSIPPTPPAATTKPIGVLITTEDAYTLTDGPTIFLADDVDKIGKFYIKHTNIPEHAFSKIMSNIVANNELTEKIDKLEREIEHQNEKSSTSWENSKMTKETRELDAEINRLRKNVRIVSLDSIYVPNTCNHQTKWTPDGSVRENAFISNIGDDMSRQIMLLDIDNHIKFLLLLGIGVFKQIPDKRYMEIIKRLADEQRLFVIIASTDYIYGTNYQFCHGFIGKDLNTMTQQKTLQAMGRVGRNNIQQDYTIRFRDDSMISSLFKEPEYNLEAINIRRLFVSE